MQLVTLIVAKQCVAHLKAARILEFSKRMGEIEKQRDFLGICWSSKVVECVRAKDDENGRNGKEMGKPNFDLPIKLSHEHFDFYSHQKK